MKNRCSKLTFTVLALALCAVVLKTIPHATGQEKKTPADAVTQVQDDPAVSQAVLAIRLAVQGEATRSPMLMLAAAEILGQLKTNDNPSDVKRSVKSETPSDQKKRLSVDIKEWQEKAIEYAKGDKELTAVVETFVEKQSSRGIINAPKNAGLLKLGTSTYRIIDSGFLAAGDTVLLTNLQYAGGSNATLGVVADVDSSFVMSGRDFKGGVMGGESLRGFGLLSWSPPMTGAYSLTIRNTGADTAYVVIAN